MINRTKVNSSQVSAQNPTKSGFNNSYSAYNDFRLGVAHVGGFHYVMPATKFSGHNKGDFMFNYLQTQFVAPIDGSQFNVAVSLRSIDNSFEDAFAPSKNNAMSANWHTPCFTLKDKILELLVGMGIATSSTQWASDFAPLMTSPAPLTSTHISDIASGTTLTNLLNFINLIPSKRTTSTNQTFDEHYLLDFFNDYDSFGKVFYNGISASTPVRQARYLIMRALIQPFFGEGSLMDELGYIIVRNDDLRALLWDGVLAFISNSYAKPSDFVAKFDNSLQCEYGLRAYYAMWYQLLRDPNLEPVSSALPKWKQFGSSSVCTLPFFIHRFRSWPEDLFVGSQPDDMMRHVYAPIFNSYELGDINDSFNSEVGFPDKNYDYNNAEGNADMYVNQHNLTSQTLTWRDSLTGSQKSITCPLPAMVNDSLRSSDKYSDVLGLDLFNLRQAQSLERYLKRNFYFGDEYKERMLAHYGSEISDYRLNYPTLLSTSINAASQDRLINNTATSESIAGERNVNMTIQTSGDGYESFAEEFAIILNLISFIPRPTYSGCSGFNLLYRQTDFPLPEFAANNEELSRIVEISCNGLSKGSNGEGRQTFGHHPYAHIWRSRVDEAHGSFRSTRSACLFTRYFDNYNLQNDFPKLNYQFIHCRPNLSMFVNQIRLDGQLSGNITHEFYVETPLPVPVESI